MKHTNQMSKIALLIILAAPIILSVNSCKKIEGCTDATSLDYNAEATVDDGSCTYPEESTKVTLLEFTATWCGPCGSWGSDAFHESLTNNPNDVIGIAVHASNTDPMYNSVSQALINNFTISGWPNFWLGNDFLGTNYYQITTLLPTYLSTAVVANASARLTKTETALEVKTSAKFFSDATGDFYLGVYVIENGIPGDDLAGAYNQNGATDADHPGYTHDHVMRAVAGSNPWGSQIVTGSITAGEIINLDFSIPMQVEWNADNVHVICIIWKANGTTYDFVNAAEAE